VTGWLIDKSVFVRLFQSPDAADLASSIERGLVRLSTVTRLEIGYSAQSIDQLRREISMPPRASMPVEYSTPSIEYRAGEVQLALVERVQHRVPSIPDLLIAASAERSDLSVLHFDKDF